MTRSSLFIMLGVALLASACASTVLTLEVGTCFDDPSEFGSVESVPTVDCAVPHDNEVYASTDLTGDSFPGDEQTESRAIEICYDAFSEYVGISYEESIYDIGWFVPTQDSWDVGDREVICFAYHIDFEKTTGSISGIGK